MEPLRITSQDQIGSVLGRVRMSALVDDGPATLPRPYRVLDAFAFAVVHRGTGTYAAPGVAPVPVRPGSALLVLPGEPHWYGPASGDTWSESFVVFDGPVFEMMREAGVLTSRSACVAVPAHMERAIHGFVSSCRTWAGEGERQLAVLDLAELLTRVYVSDEANGPVTGPVRAAQRMLADDLHAELDLTEVAARVGLPYETFRKRFRREVGRSAARFRMESRMDAARSLLRVTSMTNASISATLGFVDEHHFAKAFRRHSGISPGQFRRSHTR